MFRRLNTETRESLALAALLFAGILFMLVLYRPIHEALLLRYYYTPEQIQQDDLHVSQIIDKQTILFSNGEQRPFETRLTVLLAGLACGVVLTWVTLGYWTFNRMRRRESD